MIGFLINSMLLGVGLAMDAFSVSMANALHEPHMPVAKRFRIAGCFAGFQYLMPMIGWILVHTIVETFESVRFLIPWIALVLLLFIGGKMLWGGIREWNGAPEEESKELGAGTLLIQGIATSIDALSVGFTIANYTLWSALLCGLIIAIVTFVLCLLGLQIGRKLGTWLSGKASVLGGLILIGIGIEIFVTA